MIRLEIDDRIAEIVLDSPDRRNAVDVDDLDDLLDAVDRAEAGHVSALLVRGEGRAFCAGRDISHVDPATDDVADFLGRRVGGLMRRLADFPAPTFAAVQGACLGVGLGIALACDVVYVAESAKIGSPFVHLGAALDSGGHWLFVQRLGSHRTLDLMYTGDLMSGREAVESGLFSRWVPDGELEAFTRERVQRAAAGPTQALLASKRLVRELRETPTGQWTALDAENQAQLDLQGTADFREGFLAFQERRTPKFVGR